MKREKLNVLNERDLLLGLITSDKFCREIAPILNPRFLEIDYTRIIVGWVQDYFEKFKKAPEKDIVKIYRAHIDELTDESLQDNVLSFIEKIDKDYESMKIFNDDYALQNTIIYLKQRSLKNLTDDLEAYLTTGDVIKAETAVTKYRTVEKSTGEAVSILHNSDAVINSYAEENKVLFSLPGAYGSVVGRIHREDFISFLAPMKRGKTFMLVDIGVNAVQQGLKVLFVTLEMSESDMIKRFWTAMTGQLNEDKDDIDYPYFESDGTGYVLEHKTISRKAVSIADVNKEQKKFRRLFRGGDIRVLSVPAYSLNVEQLEVKIDKMIQQEQYTPDVVIVDYADIMAPSEKGEYRNQLDGIWKRLRALAQKRKAVVFTASQSGRSSISTDVGAENIAEDIRKLAHITSMVSLNQTPVEKKNGILRLKQLAVREGETEFRQAVCTQCLAIGRIITDSHYDDEVQLDFSENDNSEESNEDDKLVRRKKKF
jgi:KaiC/GvpD/RAD55 family RecA-like ATPase